MRNQILIIGILAMAGTSLAAQQGRAQDQITTFEFLLKKYDDNGDGKICSDEYTRGEDKFSAFDRDKDGTLSKRDFNFTDNQRRRSQRRRGQRSENGAPRTGSSIATELAPNADAGADGVISSHEWQAYVSQFDENGNGLFEDEEALAIKSAASCCPARSQNAPNAEQAVRSLDFDGDGVAKLEELLTQFNTLDHNGDNSLNAAELNSAPLVGQVAPDFELPYIHDANKTLKLSSFVDQRPVALIFGSYT